MGSVHFCIVCGREFVAATADVVICSDCGGPPEVAIESPEPGATLYDDAGATLYDEGFGAASPEGAGGTPSAAVTDRSEPGATLYDDAGATLYDEEPGATLPDAAGAGGNPSYTSEDDIPAVWCPGDVILDLYEVKGTLGEGGFGTVYRVHHRTWNLDLAVKTPNAAALQRAGSVEDFVAEAESWMDLGLHPHIVTCHYVRTLGGIPRVFAELVAGGSLADWVRDATLYAGDAAASLARLLDVAIQFAWGLHYAHERGMIHQDVKPANVLLTAAGIAKVTDFGLVRATADAGAAGGGLPGGTRVVKGRGMTYAYCSPEQVAGELLTRRTDLWSWGLSVLEMFAGKPFWARSGFPTGTLAPEALAHYLLQGPEFESIPLMPQPLAGLLREVFREDPQTRPHDLAVVAERLQAIYAQEAGRPYDREQPESTDLRADSLNNRALSLIDIDRDNDAQAAWEEALRIDAHHPQATYNYGLHRWRAAKISDQELVREMDSVIAAQAETWKPYTLMSLIHLERGDHVQAEAALSQAMQYGDGNTALRSVQRRLASAVPDRELTTFEGAMDYISTIAATVDGRYVLSGDEDGALKWWDLKTGRCALSELHPDSISRVTVVPDGRHALCGVNDKTLWLWDLDAGAHIRTFEGHEGWVWAIAVVPGGRYALASSSQYYALKDENKTIRLWDLQSGECLRVLDGHWRGTNTLQVTPDARHFLSGGHDNELWLWDLSDCSRLRTFEGHTNSVMAAALTPDGRHAISAGADATLRLWNLASGECLRVFSGHTDRVNDVKVTPDGRYAVSGGKDKTVRLWDLESGVCLRTFQSESDVEGVALVPGTLRVVSGGDPALTMWDLEPVVRAPASGWELCRPVTAEKTADTASEVQQALSLVGMAISEKRGHDAGEQLRELRELPGYERDPVLMERWHEVGTTWGVRVGLRASRQKRVIEGHDLGVRGGVFSPDGRLAASARWDKTLRLWDLDSGKQLRVFDGTVDVSALAFTPDGRRLVSGQKAGDLRLWDVETGKCLREFGHSETGKATIHAIQVTPDGRYALVGNERPWQSEEDSLRLWDLETGVCKHVFDAYKQTVQVVSISADGRRALVGGGGGGRDVRVWDLISGACLQIMKPRTLPIECVAFSPDGRFGFSGASRSDKVLRQWDLRSGECVRVFEGHTAGVFAAAVTPGGRFVLTGSYDHTLRLWSLETGECLRVFDGHSKGVRTVTLLPDGRQALSSGYDDTIRVWELDWDYDFPSVVDWDEGACPYLETFLTLHQPWGPDGLSRHGWPSWDDNDFQQLLKELGYRGYGWLRPEGVRRKLQELATKRQNR